MQQFHGQITLRHSPHLGQEFIGENGDVRLLQSRRREDVHDALGRHCAGDDLTDGVIKLVVGLALTDRTLGQYRTHVLEERHIVADSERVLMRYGEREGLG